ncbi:MAG: hypothetical protein IPM57_04600 [Oligoflexia bacterium]|nr:hypothetical protein [Oligoflexia bacterium]
MEKVKDIMERLGFREGADDSVKAAFVQNLIFQAYGVKVEVPDKYKNTREELTKQLVFNLEDVG